MQKILNRILQSAWVYYAMLSAVLCFAITPKISYYQRLNNLKDYSSYPVLYSIEQPKGGRVNVLPMRKAIRYYKLLVKLHPKLSRAYAMIGYGYYSLGNYRLAARYYLKAAEINPEYIWFYYNLGIIYFRLGDTEKAVFYFNEVLSHEQANLFYGLVDNTDILKDKAEIFNKVSFLKSMQVYANTTNFVADTKQDPLHSRISENIILDPMAYLFPIGQETLH